MADYPPQPKNKIIGNPKLSNGSVTFREGTHGNILYCEEGVDLSGATISFMGDNALVYLSENKHRYFLNVSIYRESVLFIGKNNYFNGKLNLILSERRHIAIGNDGLYSFGIWLRTADPHLIYSCETLSRINPSKNILIGDHVWVGQGSLILKGSSIHSGSIIGAHSTVSNKKICSNESWGGAPAKLIAKDVFFDNACVHNWTENQTGLSQQYQSDKWNFTKPIKGLEITNDIFSVFDQLETAEERLDYLLSDPSELQSKFRFAAQSETQNPPALLRPLRWINAFIANCRQ